MPALRLSATQNFVIATTALTAGFANLASAALISETPTGYVPLTFTAGSSLTGSFDVSGSGLDVINVSGTNATSGTKVTHAKTATISFDGSANAGSLIARRPDQSVVAASASPFAPSAGDFGNVVFLVGPFGDVSFSTTPLYGATSFLDANGDTAFGYFQGTYADSTFTLLDYGLNVADAPAAAVPEPASLALLATGMAGIAALRRRRATSNPAA